MLWLHPTCHVWGQSRPILTIQSESAVLMDGTTGQILFKKNPEKRFSPASLVKMMTLYLAFDAIKRGSVKFDQEEVVSKKPWKMGGSQMFLEVGDRVKFIQAVAQIPGVNIKEFLVTILSEAKRPQIQCLSLKGEFWSCSEASPRMVKNSFQ